MELYFKDPREYITFEHELRKARRPAYSMRAFARDLSVSPSSLNDFLKSRVGMSDERIESIANALKWSEDRKTHFRDLIVSKFDRDSVARQSAATRARGRLKNGAYNQSLDAFKVISDWYHLAIIEMCGLRKDFTIATLATELRLKPSTVQKATKRLLKLQLIEETATGFKPASDTNHYGDHGSSEAIKTFHSQIMDLAQAALLKNSSGDYDSQSMLFSIQQKDASKMNSEIRKAISDIVNRYAQVSSPDSLQAISLQSFPIWPTQVGVPQ